MNDTRFGKLKVSVSVLTFDFLKHTIQVNGRVIILSTYADIFLSRRLRVTEAVRVLYGDLSSAGEDDLFYYFFGAFEDIKVNKQDLSLHKKGRGINADWIRVGEL